MSKRRDLVWGSWRLLVNMSPSELRRFLKRYGDEAGLSRSEARAQGIRSGRESARVLAGYERRGKKIPGMIESGRTIEKARANWTDAQWKWASRQVSFISRMLGVRGPLHRHGEPTRKLLALKLWGHDPEK